MATTTPSQTIRAAIYTRISADAEGMGLGVSRQETDCKAVVDRRGWKLAGVYCDNDFSAFSMRKPRPEYQRLLDDLNNHHVDAVVTWHPDRLHRSPRDLEDFIDVIEMTGAAVATCTAGDWDLANPEGRLMARIVGSVARKESEDKSRRLRRKHQELAEDGQVSGGGRRPFGYEKDRVTIRPDEAELVREAAERILAGWSVRSVVMDWRQRSIPTVTGAAWTATTVKRLLTSGRIAGFRTHHGMQAANASWPAIITSEMSARLGALLGPERTRNGQRTATPRSYLLTGLVTCGACGARMTARPVIRKGNRYRRYFCAVDRDGCGHVGIAADPLAELVVAAVLLRLDSPQMAAALATTDDDGEADLRSAIAEDRRALSDLTQARYVDRILDHAEFMSARTRLEDRIGDLEAQLRRRSGPASQWVGHGGPLRATWAALDLERQRAVVTSVVERITIAPTSRANNRFDPERVRVDWQDR